MWARIVSELEILPQWPDEGHEVIHRVWNEVKTLNRDEYADLKRKLMSQISNYYFTFSSFINFNNFKK